MTKDLKFTEPPAAHRRDARRYDWDAVLAQLKANPTKWALLGEGERISIYNAIRGGKISNFHWSMGVEVTSANNDLTASPRTADIYVRYNPEGDTSLTVKQREQIMREARKAEREQAADAATEN